MTHPTDDSLKPCPFCGGAASLHPRTCDKNTPYNPADRAFPVARCGQCGAEALGKDWGKPETAAEKWNTRALLAEQARPTKRQTYKPGNGGACSVCGQPEGDHYRHGNDCPDMRGVEQST